MDKVIGQCYAVYDDGYRTMVTSKRLLYPWQNKQLMAELEATRAEFGLPPKPGATLVVQPAGNMCLPFSVIQRSQSCNQNTADEDEAIPGLSHQPPQPINVPYLEPSFSLDRPTHRFKMDERIKVHNNYISAVSNKMRKIDLINRLKRSEPHNTAHYQAQLEQQLVQHDDMLDRLMDILKVDDDFRHKEDLPNIDPLTAYDHVQQFPEAV